MATAKFRVEHAESLRDALGMRRARNACREQMTRDTYHIGLLQQLKWFYSPLVGWRFIVRHGRKRVGYGVISYRDGKYWVGGGLLPQFRGMGGGEALFGGMTDFVLTELCEPYCYLDVRRDNTKAKGLYRKLGYHTRKTQGDISVMRCPANRRGQDEQSSGPKTYKIKVRMAK